MKQVFLNTLIITLVASGTAIAITWIMMLMDADVLPQGALWVAMVVPASIAFPTGFLFEAQKRELLKAHSALANAHSELSMAHDAVVERSRHDFLTGVTALLEADSS